MIGAYFLSHWEHVTYFSGIVLEVWGAFLISRRYVRFGFWQIIAVLISALYRGETAQNAAATIEYIEDSTIDVLKGLALIALGSILRAVPSAVGLFT
ncbi:MAG TPA: hypothetical protein VG651_14535 [Stellaceae bacterium]|nr:hypothetical protein [Stellaceae bacterium]